MSDPALSAQPNQPVILLSGERFFVRRINLVGGTAMNTQIELALETLSPFSLEQLYHGCVLSETRSHALVYAAYRRNFPAAEQSTWNNTPSVLPKFLYWTVARRAQPGSAAIIHENEDHITAIAWDEVSELPYLILSRSINGDNAAETRAQLLAEVSRRTGIPTDQINQKRGKISAVSFDKNGLTLTGLEDQRVNLPTANLAHADIRDKGLLATRQNEQRQTTLLWRLFATAVIALAACGVIEGGLQVSSVILSGKKEQLAAQAPAVQQIESAQVLATKLEKMTAQQLRPFEMLAVINRSRPASVEFLRVSTNGPLRLDIEAQTKDAGDLRNYENALRQTAGIEQVELRDPRMRSGRTSFQLRVSFKPNWSQEAGGGL